MRVYILKWKAEQILPVENMIPTTIMFELQLSDLEDGPIINGISDNTAMAKNPMMFATDSNKAIELITFDVFNFFRMYTILDKWIIRTDIPSSVKSTMDKFEKWKGRNSTSPNKVDKATILISYHYQISYQTVCSTWHV